MPSIDFRNTSRSACCCGGQLRRNGGRRRKSGRPRPQPVQRKHLLEGLGLAAVQVRRVIVDAEQRRRVETSRPKRRAGGGVVADLQRIVDIERPHILEIFEDEVVAGERPKTHCSHGRRRGPKAARSGRRRRGCRGGRSGSSSTWLPRGRKRNWPRRPPARPHIAGLRLLQRPHGEKDPQGLHVEGLAGPLGDAVVVDGGVYRREHIIIGTRVGRIRHLVAGESNAGKAAAPLGGTGVGVEVGVAAAYGAPVEQALRHSCW